MFFIPLEKNQELAFLQKKQSFGALKRGTIKIMRRTELLLCPVNCS